MSGDDWHCDLFKQPATTKRERLATARGSCVGPFRPHLGVALVNRVRDGLHKVVPHAALWVAVSQVWVSVIAGLVAAGGPDQAQQGAAHQDQQQARGGAHRDERFHDDTTPGVLILKRMSDAKRRLCVLLCLSLLLSFVTVLSASHPSLYVRVSLLVLLVERRFKVSRLEGERW